MLTQNDFIFILSQKKEVKEPIAVGDFSKRNYAVTFEDENLNSLNLFLDISKSGSIEIKHTIQKRAKISIPLLRLDTKGYHTNPIYEENLINFEIDKNILKLMKKYSGYNFKRETHLHYYIQNFNERWAFPSNELELFPSDNFSDNIQNFCKKCNIKIQIIKKGLF